MRTLKELLIKFNAWEEVIDWAGDKTIEEVVEKCHKGEWLLDIAKKLKLPERKLISCAGHCANTVRHLMRCEKSIKLVDMCMNFEDKSISFEELEEAREAVYASAAASYAVSYAVSYAARYAFYAVCVAVSYAADDAARYASYAADCAATRKENELQTANIVRERLGQDIINEVNKLLNN